MARPEWPYLRLPAARPGRKPIATRHVLEAVLWILNPAGSGTCFQAHIEEIYGIGVSSALASADRRQLAKVLVGGHSIFRLLPGGEEILYATNAIESLHS